MRTSHTRSFMLAAMLVGTSVGLAACSSDDDKSASTTAPAATIASAPTIGSPDTEPPTSESSTTEPIGSSAADTTDAPGTAAATTNPAGSDSVTSDPATTPPATTPATTVPDAITDLAGVAPLDVTVAGTDPSRPQFSWAAPSGATSYQLVVQTADGAPLWAWTGKESQVTLGGTERPADVEGPTLTGPARVRVYALDASANLVAVSSWVALPTS